MSTVLWPNGAATPQPSGGARVTSEYGPRPSFWTPNGWTSNFHHGIDLVGWRDVVSPVDGVVTFAGYNGGAGNEVRIREDGTRDIFREMHHARLYVRTGQRVYAGQPIGLMGTTGNSTGVHCHHEVRPGGGSSVNPRDYHARRYADPTPAPTPVPTTQEEDMSVGVIYTDESADKNRSGAIIDTRSGTFSDFGWFPISYANDLAIAFGAARAAKVTRGHYDAIRRHMAALRASQGKVQVDFADEAEVKVMGDSGN